MLNQRLSLRAGHRTFTTVTCPPDSYWSSGCRIFRWPKMATAHRRDRMQRYSRSARHKCFVRKNIGTLEATTPAYADYVNPQWVRLLNLLQMNVRYPHCVGTELFTEEGRRILDFLSGYCVHNTGHNHAAIIAALKDELDRCGPAMLQSHVAELAGELAARLCRSAGGRAEKVFFCSSGSEGVEAVIKFARAHTRRSGLLYAERAFHGLTCGALSLMSDGFW